MMLALSLTEQMLQKISSNQKKKIISNVLVPNMSDSKLDCCLRLNLTKNKKTEKDNAFIFFRF